MPFSNTLMNSPCLIWAAFKGDTDKVKSLLNESNQAEACAPEDNSTAHTLAIMWAVANDFTALMYAAREGHTQIAKLLIEYGADINAQNIWDGYSALMYATQGGYRDIADLLISKGANTQLRAKNGYVVGATEAPQTKPKAILFETAKKSRKPQAPSSEPEVESLESEQGTSKRRRIE